MRAVDFFCFLESPVGGKTRQFGNQLSFHGVLVRQGAGRRTVCKEFSRAGRSTVGIIGS